MEGAARIELAFAVPVTDDCLEDSPDYAPKIGLAFSSEANRGGNNCQIDTLEHANRESRDCKDVDQRVIEFVIHVRVYFQNRNAS